MVENFIRDNSRISNHNLSMKLAIYSFALLMKSLEMQMQFILLASCEMVSPVFRFKNIYTHILTSHTKAISRNQSRAGL